MKIKQYVEIKVLNWNKYNSRNDLKHHTWFKLKNNIFINPEYSEWNSTTYVVLVFILCQCSIQQKDNFVLTMRTLAKLIRTKDKLVQNALNILQQYQVITFKISENPTGIWSAEKNRVEKIRIDKSDVVVLKPTNTNFLKITDLWLSVLSTFGIERNKPHLQEAQMLHSLLEANGYENLALAIIGMSYETRNDSYQPEKFLSTKLLANNFERFLNLGAKNKVDFIKNNISKLTKESFDLIQKLDVHHA